MKKLMLFLLSFVFSIVLLADTKMITEAATTITPIKTNSDVIGVVPKEDALYYSFETKDYGYFTFTVAHTNLNESGDFKVRILNSEQDELLSYDSKKVNSCKFACVPGMTYYISVGNSWGATGKQFKLRVNEVKESNWEQEVNDNQTKATKIPFNTTIKGVLSGSLDEEDWYKFTIDKSGYFEVELKHTELGENGEYRVEVLETDGTTIASSYGKKISLNRKGYNKNSVIYVKVTNSWGSKCQPYELKVNYVASDVYESEGNNSQGAADAIAFGKKYYGLIGESNDSQDWFTFTNPKTGIVTLNFGPDDVSKKGDWRVSVVDSKGNEKQVYADSVVKSVPMLLQKGKFYLKVTNSWGASEKLYTISVSRKDFSVSGKTKIKSTKCKKGFFSRSLSQVKLSKKAKNASEYEVKVSKSKKIKRPVINVSVKAGKTLSVVRSISKGTYYVQVRPFASDVFGKPVYGSKSNVLKFKVK